MTANGARLTALTDAVRNALGNKRLAIIEWRSGTDFWADLVVDDEGATIGVLRSPLTELLSTSYEGIVDFGQVIETEVQALGLMRFSELPVPAVIAWGRRGTEASSSSWILLEHIEHDIGGQFSLREMGDLTRQLHAIEPNSRMLRPKDSWAEYFWARLRGRLEAARAYCGLPPDSVLEPVASRILGEREGRARSLLHMDLRSENICARGGRIVALIDVANCLVGDPLLELARVRAYGTLTEEFLQGYGADAGDLADGRALDLYELETAALLTAVAVEEIDDRALHEKSALRTRQLFKQLVGGSGG